VIFFLLMATFYDNIDSHTDVVFVCNNVTTIREISKQFPKVKKWWFYPRASFHTSPIIWELLVQHPNFVGSGVTPRQFMYVEDWIECGKTNVFDYYGVKRYPAWAFPIPNEQVLTVIQPFGGADDPTKIKEIPRVVLNSIANEYSGYGRVCLIGSKKDKEKIGEPFGDVWVTDFENSFRLIRSCSKFIGADSWGKTLAAFAGKEVVVYPNRYEKPAEKMFNHPKDPGDYVFLDGWGFGLV